MKTSPILDELLERLQVTDEVTRIEVKSGSELGKSGLETISAFCNEPGLGGGYLLFGLEPAEQERLFGRKYKVVGVPEPDKLQSEIATACANSFSTVVRPTVHAEPVRRGGKTVAVVVAQIPEAQDADKPVYVKSRGIPRGAFRRVGPTDHHCEREDLERFAVARAGLSEDLVTVPGLAVSDLDTRLVHQYRRYVARLRPDSPALNFDDSELLEAIQAISGEAGTDQGVTLAGMVLFGTWKALRKAAPMHRVEYIRVPGVEWVPDPAERFESVDLLGGLLDTLPRAVRAVMDDIPRAFHLEDGELQRRDVPRIPELVVREAVVNAVAHRDYRVRQPIQLIRYDNRLEIRNPGFSLKDPEHLGAPGSRGRNEHILAVLQETGFAEAKGTGIRSMRKAMEDAGLAPPLFESHRVNNEFVVRLSFHHFLNPQDWQWLRCFKPFELEEPDLRALLLVRELGAIDNSAYRDLNHVDTLTASQRLRHLRDIGLLGQKGQSVATYYVFGEEALRVLEPLEAQKVAGAEPANLEEQPDKLDAQSDNLDEEPGRLAGKPINLDEKPTNLAGKPINLDDLPGDLREQILGVGRYASAGKLQAVVASLCRYRPMSKEELASILGRNEQYIGRVCLSPMLRQGRISMLFPQVRHHPQQRYLAVDDSGGEDTE